MNGMSEHAACVRSLYGMTFLRTLFSLLSIAIVLMAGATHNRAGEILVCHLGGNMVQATIITHTDTDSPVDRPELELHWGDGSSSMIDRSYFEALPGYSNVRKNVYVGTHTYAGPFTYTLWFHDPNRNPGVNNVPNSVNQVFAVQSMIALSSTAGNNCSVQFANSPIQNACLNQVWVHNPAAYDTDGDSLGYEAVVCLGLNAQPLNDYIFPGPNYSIDPIDGTIVWNSPGVTGEYNIAFKVTEWRRNVWGVMEVVGFVIRDMQITVVACDNQPPVVQDLVDTCVVAGTLLSFNVPASDPNTGQSVTLNALGQPFLLSNFPASFIPPSAGNPVNGIFSWNTACAHVRTQPYQVVFTAIDNGANTGGEVNLQDYETMTIRIVAPAPEDPAAQANGPQIELSWQQSICSNATGYRIYRRVGTYGFEPDHCETGVPAYTGYMFLASVSGVNNTTHIDQQDLIFGQQYCYMVTAVFADGAESYASEEFCALLNKQVPIMTNVSVGETDPVNGIDTVRWTNAFDLDTATRPGPYKFLLYRGTGFNEANELIWESGLHDFIDHPDTSFIDTSIDTENTAHVYRVVLLGAGGNDTIGSANEASSVFISADPNDEQITISWQHNVPWTNYQYEIYRETAPDIWELIGTSTTQNFVDTGLINGEEYCYYVKSLGEYGDTTIVSPLINFSQEVCGIPVDLTPPCPPVVALENDCELPLNTLSWANTDLACPDTDDTFGYNIYFTDSLGGAMALIGSITAEGDTLFFTHTDGQSVAGCYAVTAVDQLGNESERSNTVCGDNCPVYELPNIFTPNGDNSNDLFGPFPYRGVKEIELEIFNRWGHLVFESTDPDIEWRGTYRETNEPLPDGVYYYVCTVLQQRLIGVEPVVLKGYVHIVGGGAPKQVP